MVRSCDAEEEYEGKRVLKMEGEGRRRRRRPRRSWSDCLQIDFREKGKAVEEYFDKFE